MQISRLLLALLIGFLLLMPRLHAQCYGNPQAEATACANTPVLIYAQSGCPNCTYNWTGSPSPIAGQGTAIATFVFPFNGFGNVYRYPAVQIYNPNGNCNYADTYQTTIGAQPAIALPTLVNGPWDGDTGKVWIYARSYIHPNFGNNVTYTFNPSWTVTGGTKLRSTHFFSMPNFYDSVFVKWSGPSGMNLIEAQWTHHEGNYGFPFNCNWTPAPSLVPYPTTMNVFHPAVCVGGTGNFYTFPYANSTYTWSVSNGSVVSGQGTNSAQIQVSANGTVTVQRDSSGTITTASINVTPTMPAVGVGPDQVICQGTSATLTATSGFSSYQWSNGASGQTIVTANPGQYIVTASINGGCTATDTVVITQTPVVTPNLGPDVNTCTFPIVLDAGPGYTSYQWSNGAATQAISLFSGGSYQVTVTNANGCNASDAVLVYDRRVTVNLGANATYCNPGTHVIHNSGGNGSIYLWSTGAVTSSITVSNLGPQTYWLQASNAYGCSGSDTTVITGVPNPTPNLGPDQTVCPGTSVILNGGAGYQSYSWTPTGFGQFKTVTAPGTYSVTVIDANGCTGTDAMQLLNYAFTRPNLGPDVNVCQPTTTLDAGPGYSSYLWNNGATTQSIVVGAGGNYAVTTTGVNGCMGADTINVAFAPIAFSLGSNTTVCEPYGVLLNPNLVGNYTYNWNTGATSPTLLVNAVGTNNISVTVTNALGCSTTQAVVITVLPTLPLYLGSDTVICADTTLMLDAGTGFISYLWSTGATSQSIVTALGGLIAVDATLANGCVVSDTISVSNLVDCVFPGDANYDGGADLMDVLAIGTAIGMTGFTRPNASLHWHGQHGWSWSGTFMTGVNTKQADTNGDGVISMNDTVAVHTNFGNTHSRIGDVTTGNAEVRIVPLNGPVSAGDIAQFGVYYDGGNGAALDSVHGLALQLNWPSVGISGPGLVAVDYSNAWFAPAGNRMKFTQLGNNSAGIALSRISGTDTSGAGLVMVLSFQTDPNLPSGQGVSFVPSVTMAQGVGHNLIPAGASVTTTPISIVGAVGSSPRVVAQVIVSPNPASKSIHVRVDGQEPRHVQLINLMGQVVIDQMADGQRDFTLAVDQLPAGNYCIHVQTEDGLVVKKVIVAH